MTSFMHKLAEGLRTREQYLEEHSEHPIFETEEGDIFKEQYDDLVTELKEFSNRVGDLAAAGEDFDERFEREISDSNEHLSIKIDAWAKNLDKK
ncbi:hypothetical protein MNBD_ALPHA01-1821 [hydrothermal vent metagenome]|uniref:Uncharacterized protein n=1 Tax=hydrothermal vent metagenome TaxID=652676 RepID=A0A3B0SMR3_9ZZZZ